MKIVYLADIDLKFNKGVATKLRSQMQHWIGSGHEVELLLIGCEDLAELETLEIPVKNIYYPVKIFPKKGINVFLSKILSINKINKYLKQVKPDLIYYRCSMWIPGLDHIIAAHMSVMEVNSKDLEEIKSWGRTIRWLYKYGRKKILNNVDGIVSVSHELAEEFISLGLPTIVIGNGITLSNKVSERTISDSVNLVFVGSLEQYWQGVDKVYFLATHLPEFNFHIVGEKSPQKELPNVYSHGYLAARELNLLYERMHIGIGTLALHRKNMEEASPLKVREYISHGLPVIIGYHDTDLASSPQVLRINNSETNVSDSIEAIRNFIVRQAGSTISEEVRLSIDYAEKEHKRLTFFEHLSKEGRK